jgi:hypothetical protein
MLQIYTRRTRSDHGMSDTSQGPRWWLASDAKWYPPDVWTGPPSSGPLNTGPTGAAIAQPVIETYPEQAPLYGAAGRVPSGQLSHPVGGPSTSRGDAPYAYGRSASYGQPVQRRIIVGFGWLAFLVLGIALGVGNHNNDDVVGPFV